MTTVHFKPDRSEILNIREWTWSRLTQKGQRIPIPYIITLQVLLN